MAEAAFFWKLLEAALPPAIALTTVIMTLVLVIRNYGGAIIRYIGRFVKWFVMTLFNEPEAAQHVKKSWRDSHAN
ncbi:hypothetical protein FKV75_00190 [Weissella paramesenteroides]|uniref:hypothetical protein n=1 Tax=Weissella paramesenteroides TaxID=1249 RepID=UPI0012390AD1|nr:hypothetical protein [Weissella paramesenteroides]KAA8442674.1 hypothetical protein FKV77_05485 [Weissella paramesenteroides]KAA8443020.1 hypothetical protein FKV81_01475 [Weissella paramesenteroides]KAA8444304.1 hypothetical protein FKV75_00190 [Weissella paramesenteroides]KAA8447972.1 hypothetical protein FKV76_01755 [Weissella paramesenteroides]KAA8452215.1 hypothetical protein FKV74_01475 [Weissella paramesenteroides]